MRFNQNWLSKFTSLIINIYLVPLPQIKAKRIRAVYPQRSGKKLFSYKITSSCRDDYHQNHPDGPHAWGFVIYWNHPQRGKRFSHFCVHESSYKTILNHHDVV